MKNKLKSGFIVLVVLLSLVLLFSNHIREKVIENNTEQYQGKINSIEPIKIKENQTKNANYDFDQVESISDETLLKAQMKRKNEDGSILNEDGSYSFNIVGFVAVPTVQINLPIFLGVANENLLYGSGTVKQNQKLGQGNYALASHRTSEPNLLFTPLQNISIGDPIYLTDKENVYEYITTSKFEVEPNQSEVIEDTKGKTLVTLITCNSIKGERRLIVQGELKQSWNFNNTPDRIKDVFNITTATF